jgi:hypothetical protein
MRQIFLRLSVKFWGIGRYRDRTCDFVRVKDALVPLS